MKDWEILKCDNCGAPMKPTGCTATCEYCFTVYVRDGESPPRDTVFTFGEVPPMSGEGWTIAVPGVNPLAFDEAPPMSGEEGWEEGWVDGYGNRYGAFDV